MSTFIIGSIIAVTGFTSVFAEKAVPGDLLYKIKVSVNEPTAGIFALSKEEKTEWQERLVERRLDEAQKLVSKNNLDETTRINLEDQIKIQIDKFNTSVKELSLKKNESINSSDLNIRLLASLKAYQNVIGRLSEKADISKDTKNEAEKLLSALEELKIKVKQNHESLELNVGAVSKDALSISDSSRINKISADSESSLAKETSSENLLISTKILYQKERSNLSTNIQNQIDNKLALAESALQEGKTLVPSEYTEATDKFQSVINFANGAKLLILSNIIKGDIENNEDFDENLDDIEDDDFESSGNINEDHSNSSEIKFIEQDNNDIKLEEED